MILEGIVTTLNADGIPNISPMGPRVEDCSGQSIQSFVLSPYQTSTTYRNLKRAGEGILHITDDVELLARSAVGQPDPLPPLIPADAVKGMILAEACRWYAFRVAELDDREPRTKIACNVVDRGRQRDFFGFNRAKHAVLEAAILATRIEFLPAATITAEMERLSVVVDKTAGEQERRAFSFLQAHIRERLR